MENSSNIKKYIKGIVREILRETTLEESQQLDEKLITYSNRAPYGQIVFVAGGAGSGKGFAIKNFMDSSSFIVRDVDEMKKQLQKLASLGIISIDKILDRFGNSIKPKDVELIKKIKDGGYELSTMNLRLPDHVYALHILVKAMGIKDESLKYLLAGKSNPQTLPNIIFDITAKDINDITSVIPELLKAGYKQENIHLTWVLTNYSIAVKANAERDRVVPADILLSTHVGAGNTIWGVVTSALPKGMNGRIDVILNNRENTIAYKDKDGKDIKGAVKGFLSLPIKKQGASIYPESLWREILYKWVKDNGPKELTSNFQ